MGRLPEPQKQMIMRQMGPQMEMFEKMAAGGGLEVESVVTGMLCDAGVPENELYMQTIPGVSQGACIGFGADGEQGSLANAAIKKGGAKMPPLLFYSKSPS
jgi:hypothetical protein